jgi:hypothetical protein
VSAALRVFLLLTVLLLLSRPAGAEAPRVLLVRPQRTDPTITAAFSRLRGELMASGFTVVIHDEQAGTSPKTLAAAAHAQGAFASIAIVRSNGLTTADVWISDRVSGKTSVRTISTTKRDAPDLLAVRATDLLKVSLREFGEQQPPPDIASADPSETLPPEVHDWAALPAAASTLRLHAGVAALATVSDIAPGVGPGLGFAVAPAHSLELLLAFAGPLLTPDWTASEGRVGVRQELASMALNWAPWQSDLVALEATAGVGGYHLAVRGEPEPPLLSRSDDVWSLVLAPGAALSVRISTTAAVRFAAAATFLIPEPKVRIGDTQERLGQPALLAAAGLRVGL